MVLENYIFFRSKLSAIWEVCLYCKRKSVSSWQVLHSCTDRWRHLTCFCLGCVYARNRRRKWYKRAILQGILNLYIDSTSLHFNNRELIFMTVKNHKEIKISIDKGQLISKCLFGIFNCPKKQTKKFNFTIMVPKVKLFLFVFWENWRHQKDISILNRHRKCNSISRVQSFPRFWRNYP